MRDRRFRAFADAVALGSMVGWLALGVLLEGARRGVSLACELGHLGLLHALGAPVPPPSAALRQMIDETRRAA